MPAFQSADAYGRFARAVTRSTRYVRDKQANDFLDTLAREAESRVEVIPVKSILWRAQLGHDWVPVQEGDQVVAEVPGPFPPERMKPLRDRARDDRAAVHHLMNNEPRI